MEYEDIRITITAKIKEGHRVLIDSPAGDFAGTFVNPIDKSNYDNMLVDNGLRVESREDARKKKKFRNLRQVMSTNKLEDVGRELSEALFQNEILDAYAQSKGIVDAKERGLRVRIRIDPGIEEYAELMNLPWEFLHDNTQNLPIELMDNRAIIRDSITPRPVTSLNVNPPLRVLAVASDPSNYPRLKLGREKDFLKSMSEQIPNIEVKLLRKSTIGAVYKEMRRRRYHVFHFMGHGGYSLRRKRCVLIFKREKNRNRGIAVDGEQLKIALTKWVRLVFINACETARIPEENPFEAIPTELLQRGIPAVLSMQFPISDIAAIEFCKSFYGGLSKRDPVDQCVRNGRQQIRLQQEISAEWGTPVLYMRSPDGRIVTI